MNRRSNPIPPTAALLALLLACLLIPLTALAATSLGNDNHTDTDDYCLRAHDVRIGLSEFSTRTRTQLEADIVSASAFEFYYRSDWSSVTSGYSVDFSNLVDAVSSTGYPVTVTLDPVSMSVSSYVTFRVFVVDDTPTPTPSYPVTYQFISATPGHDLPEGVLSQLPADTVAGIGETVAPSFLMDAVRDGAGEWTFSGWTPADQFAIGPGVAFTGSWTWTALPVYSVEYVFVSSSSGRALPDKVLDQLPAGSFGVEGDVFTAPGSCHSVRIGGGVWRFKGWSAASLTITDGDLTFTGTWRWYTDHTSAAATSEPTPAASPTAAPTPEITPPPTVPPETPQPTASASPAMQVLEQTNSNTPAPPTGSAKGGAAQMMIATVLTALVATQAFAVASDLKVLKWYDARKAARRTNA